MYKQLSIVTAALALLTVGCSEFDPGSLIEDTRVLGATLSVMGDEDRASPMPGETVRVTWITAAPSGTPTLRWAFVGCAPEEGMCEEATLGPFEGEGEVASFDLTVPSASTLGSADALQLLGVICDGGTPGLDETGLPTCTGSGARGTNVKLDVAVARDGQLNHNPHFTGAELRFDEAVFAPGTADVAEGTCADDATLPRVKAGSKSHDLALELDLSVRERYREESRKSEVLEELQISAFVTAGELDRQFSFVEGESNERPLVDLSWDAPGKKDVPAGGKLVRFTFVVRDLRGGTAVTTRALCVTP